MRLAASDILPDDARAATLVGRVWIDAPVPGPRTFLLRAGMLVDLSALAPTMSDLIDLPDASALARAHAGPQLCSLEEALDRGALLAPCDLQAVKAAGVTFATSLIERVLEERARGDPVAASNLRAGLAQALGGSLAAVVPGSGGAREAKRMLIAAGLWSQYLEVGIGPDPELFTKAQPMAAVGCGAVIALHPRSEWTCSEPEVVLAISSRGAPVGATLGNDFTLRDFEGRSALLLGQAKDGNASCAVGPFVRLFDDRFGMEDVRTAEVRLQVEGPDDFIDEGTNSLREISRDPLQLVGATIGAQHQYPDGLMLFLGTMFVPNMDRGGPGRGFTHVPGDIVSISSPRLGCLTNIVTTCEQAPRWEFGTRALMASLGARGALLFNRESRETRIFGAHTPGGGP